MRIVKLAQILPLRRARSTDLARLDSQIGLSQSTFGDQFRICATLMTSAELKLAVSSNLRLGVSSGARSGFRFRGSDLLVGSGEVEAMTIEGRLSRGEGG